MREIITFRCEEKKDCGMMYHSMKNKKNTKDRMLLKKFCKKCKKHTSFKEEK